MVKGISRRVVVVESPDPRYFEQAIFILRNDAANQGVSSKALVEEARQVARNYAGTSQTRLARLWHELNPLVYMLLGAGGFGLVWFLVSLLT